MSLQDIADRHSARRKSPLKAHRRERAALQHPDKVWTFPAWCVLNGISESTGRRILQSGNGPKVVWLSTRRMGIRESDNRAWQETLVR
jgi:hypothetical protein